MRGGQRRGAGRKQGSVNKTTAYCRDQAAKAGELPHEFLLRVARGEVIDGHSPEFPQRIDAAKAAAPYFAARLAATTIDLSVRPKTAVEMTDEELMACLHPVRESTQNKQVL